MFGVACALTSFLLAAPAGDLTFSLQLATPTYDRTDGMLERAGDEGGPEAAQSSRDRGADARPCPALPGLLFCLPQSYDISAANRTLVSVREVDADGAEGEELVGTPFAAAASLYGLSPVEAVSLPDVLAADAYYSSSLRYWRYDDFELRGGVVGDVVRHAAGANCALISARWWEPNTRYAVTMRLGMDVPDGVTASSPPPLWTAPLAYELVEEDAGRVAFTVRGDKYGQVCEEDAAGVAAPAAPLQYATVAKAACERFTAMQEDLLAGEMSDLVVAAAALDEFLEAMAGTVDRSHVAALEPDFLANYVSDGRRPSDPSRRLGLLPNCAKCEDGRFADYRSGELATLADRRFAALLQLRLIGFVLARGPSEYECAALFSESDPTAPIGEPMPAFGA